jgi:ribose 5-phosphate isomerase A
MSGSRPTNPADTTALKQQAAQFAVNFVQSGMVVGLGSGSTTLFAIRELGQRLQRRELIDIAGFPTSDAVASEAARVGIPLVSVERPPQVDLTIDGADEVDPELNLIKGGGGALLREKIVAQASRREVIIVDDSKLSPCLGTNWPLPVEVIPFGWDLQRRFIEDLGARVELRHRPDGRASVTDQQNFILDCHFGPIYDASRLARQLAERAGIVEHGLFIGVASDLVVAGQGGIQHRTRSA